MKITHLVPVVPLAFGALLLTGCGKPATTGDAATKPVSSALAALPKIGPAPAWKLKDVDGKDVAFAQLKGKVVVVDFWATWCGPCRVEIPGYVAMQKKYGDQLAIVGVSLDQGGPEVVKAFAAKYGINYALVMGDDEIQKAFGGIEAIPTTFLIDRDGQIRDRKVGAEHSETYEQKVAAVLGEGAKKS
ncbi:MAG: TlpA family protein disulfide reductase [Opitutaceae bacterium]|nr:TlpA family protein disulfide reductase [Opitutaceae bacterium]